MSRFKHFKQGFKLLAISKVGPKGQVVVPAEARTELGINPGDTVVVMGFPHKRAVMIVNQQAFEQHMRHVERHFNLIDEYENLRNREDKFDD